MSRFAAGSLLLLAVLAGTVPARALPAPDSTALAGLRSDLARLRRVRLAGDTRVLTRSFLVVEGPGASEAGLAYASLPDFRSRRPALITNLDYKHVQPPPNPIPWDALQEVQVARSRAKEGAVAGGLAGGLLSLAWTCLVYMTVEENPRLVALAGSAALVAAGAAGSDVLVRPVPRWERVYPPPPAPDEAPERPRSPGWGGIDQPRERRRSR